MRQLYGSYFSDCWDEDPEEEDEEEEDSLFFEGFFYLRTGLSCFVGSCYFLMTLSLSLGGSTAASLRIIFSSFCSTLLILYLLEIVPGLNFVGFITP